MSAPDKKNTFVREYELNSGKSLKIHQYEVGDVGCVVWDAALALSKYIETPKLFDQAGNHQFLCKNIVELGAGTGLVGLVGASLGLGPHLTLCATIYTLW